MIERDEDWLACFRDLSAEGVELESAMMVADEIFGY